MLKVEENRITRKDFNVKLRGKYYQIIYKNPESGERCRISLGTTDEKRAWELAQRHWDNILDDFDRGILVRDKESSQIIKEFLEAENKQYNRDTIQRHFLPYIKENKIKLSKLKQSDINGYFTWRKKRPYKGHTVTDITLNREICALRKFLNFAKEEKYIPAKREIKIEMFEVTPIRRDALPTSSLKELLYQAQKRYKEAKRQHIKSNRLRIYRYVEFLCTVVRCGTAIGLQWKDVFLDEEKPYYVVRPENNKTRKQLIEGLSPRFVKKFKQYKQEQINFCHKHNIKFSDEFYVFSDLLEYKTHKEGRPDAEIKAVKSSRTAWDGLVKSCSFYKPNVKYVPYQIRHTMITQMVTKKVPVDVIAKLACTSSAMINKFYDSSTAMDFLDDAIANDLACDICEEAKIG